PEAKNESGKEGNRYGPALQRISGLREETHAPEMWPCLLHLWYGVTGGRVQRGAELPCCLIIFQKEDIRPQVQMELLVSKINVLEPQLSILAATSSFLRTQKLSIVGIPTKIGIPKLTNSTSPELLFNSGHHYWEVDLGTSKDWAADIFRESAP
ncbi:LOW QUALITY PROTEIN: hypothetical protein J0S82_010921, partial [Galemys pyrenaicus]